MKLWGWWRKPEPPMRSLTKDEFEIALKLHASGMTFADAKKLTIETIDEAIIADVMR